MQPYDFTDRDMHTTILVAKVQKIFCNLSTNRKKIK